MKTQVNLREREILPISCSLARVVSKSASWIRWAPDRISSPLMNMSYELEDFWGEKKKFSFINPLKFKLKGKKKKKNYGVSDVNRSRC